MPMFFLKRKTTATNRRRKGRLAVLIPWLRRFGMIVASAVFLLWLGAWFFMSEADTRTARWAQGKILAASADMGFTVDNIIVEGRVHTDPDILRALINVKKGDPLFSFDPKEARPLIERISWVEIAHVERRLPDTIYLGLTERRPLAVLATGNRRELVDTKGKIITRINEGAFGELIVVSGEKAARHAPALIMNIAAEPALAQQIVAARYVGGRRWDIIFKSGITANLPEQDTGLALRRLAFIQEDENILDKDISNIDLRQPGRIVVRTGPGGVQEYKAGLEAGDAI